MPAAEPVAAMLRDRLRAEGGGGAGGKASVAVEGAGGCCSASTGDYTRVDSDDSGHEGAEEGVGRVQSKTLRARARLGSEMRRIRSLPELIMDDCTMGVDEGQVGDGSDNLPLRVLDGIPLFIGSAEAAANICALAERGITHVLTVGTGDIQPALPAWVRVHRVELRDSPSADLFEALAECLPFIDEGLRSPGSVSEAAAPQQAHRAQGVAAASPAQPSEGGADGEGSGGVLVHCVAGVSRSAAVVLAYVMVRHGLGLQEALSGLQAVRPQVSPNSGFLMQLEELQSRGPGELLQQDGGGGGGGSKTRVEGEQQKEEPQGEHAAACTVLGKRKK